MDPFFDTETYPYDCPHMDCQYEELCINGGQPDETWETVLVCLKCGSQGVQTDEGLLWA